MLLFAENGIPSDISFLYFPHGFDGMKISGKLDISENGTIHIGTENRFANDIDVLTYFCKQLSATISDNVSQDSFAVPVIHGEHDLPEQAAAEIYRAYLSHLKEIYEIFINIVYSDPHFTSCYRDLVNNSALCSSLVHKCISDGEIKQDFDSFHKILFDAISVKNSHAANKSINQLTRKTLQMTALSIGVAFFAGSLFADAISASIMVKGALVFVAGIVSVLFGHRILSEKI